MLTWNTREITTQALRQLRATDQGVPYRLLVRDNASDDDTASAAKAAFPEAIVDAADTNLGFAAGMNALTRDSDAPYVLILNGDAWLEDGALLEMVTAAKEHSDAGAIAPRLLRPDGSFEHSTWPFPSLRLSALYATGVRRLLPHRLAERWMLMPDWRHDRPRYVSWAIGAALLIPADVLRQVGGFDESYFMYGEDVDWCWRLRDAGYRIWFEPSAVVRHVGGASAATRYAHRVMARKAVASTRVMTARHGRVVGQAYRALECLTAIRIGIVAWIARDRAGVRWARDSLRSHLRAAPPE